MSNKEKKYLKFVCLIAVILVIGELIFIGKTDNDLEVSSTMLVNDNGVTKGVSIEKISDSKLETFIEKEPIDILDIPLDKIVEDKYQRLFYIGNSIKRRVTRNGHSAIQLRFSPSKNKFGYLENSDISDESISWDQEIILHIGEIVTKETKEIYHGSHRTAGWEWFSEDEVLIPYGCGTECQVLYLVNVNSGFKETIQQGVGYEWSNDKNWLFAYRYSGKLGIVVFDRNQNQIYEYLKDPNHRDKYEVKIKGLWAPSSNRLAMVKEKDNKDQLELIIADFDKAGKILIQKDLGEVGCSNMWWGDDNEFYCNEKLIQLKKE